MTSSPFAFLRRWDLRAPITALQTNRRGDWAALALASGSFAFLPTDDAGEDPLFLPAHEGAVTALISDADDHAFLSGGRDGQVLIVESGVAAPTPLAQSANGTIVALASAPSGLRAFADPESLYLLGEAGEPVWRAPIRAAGSRKILFSPTGEKLFLADASGWRLFDLASPSAPRTVVEKEERLLDFIWSVDGETLYLLTQEKHLQFWSEKHGLVGVRPLEEHEKGATSLALAAKERFLLLGGETQAFALPLSGGAPWQNAPMLLGEPETPFVTCLAPNPKDNMAAIGYQDGSMALAPLDGRREIPVFPSVAPKGAKVTGLGWNARGDSFLAAMEGGTALLFTLQSVTRFVRSRVK